MKRKKFIVCLLTLTVVMLLATVLFAACDNGLQNREFSIVLDFNDGVSETLDYEFSVQDGLAAIPTPQRTGYTFTGWALDKEGAKEVIPDELHNGIILYAQWQKNKYTVNFYIGDTLIDSQEVPYLDDATAPDDAQIAAALPDGFGFERWDKSFINVTSNLEVHAVLTAESHTVVFSWGDGQTYTYEGKHGEKIPTPPLVQKDGFEFVDWVDADGDVFDEGDAFIKDSTYFAKWQLAMPSINVVGNLQLAYGNDLILQIESLEAESVSYSYKWTESSATLSSSADLNIARPNAGVRSLTAEITASASGYDSVTASNVIEVRISKRQLTASAQKITLTYGDALPENITLDYVGFLDGDNESLLKGQQQIVSDYSAGDSVGNYTASVSGITAENYELAAVSVDIEVKAKTVSYTYSDDKTYDGEAYSFNQSGIIFDGLLEGHAMTLAFTTNSANAAEYKDIVPSSYSITDGEGQTVTENYNVKFNLSIDINKARLIVDINTTTVADYDGLPHAFEIGLDRDDLNIVYVSDGETEQNEAPTYTNADTYMFTVRITSENYLPYETTCTLIINKAKITVRALPQTAVYGNDFELDQSAYETEGKLFGNVLTVNLMTDYVIGNDAKDYVISVTADAGANFDISAEPSTLTVNKAAITVSAPDASVTYGEELSLDGLSGTAHNVPSHGASVNITLSTDYTMGGNVNESFHIFATAQSDNYTIESTPGTLTVLARQVTFAIDDANVKYGDAFDLASHTYKISTGSLYGQDNIALAMRSDYEPGMSAGSTCSLSADYEQNDNYEISILDGDLTVVPRELSVKVKDASVRYGEEAPQFEYEITDGSFYNAESPLPTYRHGYRPGVYEPIEVNVSFDDPNYNISTTVGTLNILARTLKLSISATYAQNGTAWQEEINQLQMHGIFENDIAEGKLATSGSDEKIYTAHGSDIGDFRWINAFTVRNGNGDDVTKMYELEYDLSIQITPKPISYTISETADFEYDGERHGRTLDVQFEGEYTVQYSYNTQTSTDAPMFKDSGSYLVHFVISAEGMTETAGDYSVNITARKASITVTPKTIAFGDARPDLEYSENNILPEDKAALNISLSTEYTVGNNVGIYPISVSYEQSDNYDIAVTDANITVVAKTVKVTITSDLAITYGDAAPKIEFTLDDEAAREALAISHGYEQFDGVNSYPLSLECSDDNYSASFAEEYAIVVGKKNVTVVINSLTVEYGTQPQFAYTAELVGDDNINVNFVCNAIAVGEHEIDATVDDDPNYNFTIQKGTLTIQKANLKLFVEQNGKISYGDDIPEFVVTHGEGFKYDDDVKTLDGALIATHDYTRGDNVGSYVVSLGGLTSNNYEISYAQCILVVDKAKLTITVDPHDPVTYGDEVPTDFSYVVQGLVNGDSEQSLELGIQITTTYEGASSNASAEGYEYNVQLAVSELDNYDLIIGEAQRLVVNKAEYDRDEILRLLSGYSVVYTSDNTLENITLSEGFEWANASEKLICKKNIYSATYLADPINFEPLRDIDVTVDVAKADPVITATGNDFATWTGSAIDIVSTLGLSLDGYDGGNVLTYEIYGGNLKPTIGGIYKVTVNLASSDNWNAASYETNFKIKSAKIGNDEYVLEDALELGGNITLFGDAQLTDQSRSYELKHGSTLLLPYDRVSAFNTNGGTEKWYADIEKESTYLQLVLTIGENVTFDISGVLNIGGVTGFAAQYAYQGHTSGNYAQMTIKSGANVNLLSGGKIDVYGYIKGDGTLNVKEGAEMLAPFVVRDFRGGTSTAGSIAAGHTTLFGIMPDTNGFYEDRICPFNQWEMPNVQVTQYIYTGSTVKAHCNLYADSKFNTVDSVIFAKTNALLNLTEGYLVIKNTEMFNSNQAANAATLPYRYSTSTSIDLYGTAASGELSLELNIKIPITIKTSIVTFAIPYNFKINIKTSSTMDISYAYKLMPGAQLTVDTGATLNLLNGGRILVYDGDNDANWMGTAGAGSFLHPANEDAAKLTVNGILNAQKGSYLGGLIASASNGAKIVLDAGATLQATAYDGYGESITKSIQTHTESNALTLNGYAEVVKAGNTYTYNGAIWEILPEA